MSEDDNYEKCKRAIRQILHQTQILSNVWSEVLPVSVYYKSIGQYVLSSDANIPGDGTFVCTAPVYGFLFMI